MHFQEHIIQTVLQFYAGTQQYLLNFRPKEIPFSDFTSQTARSQITTFIQAWNTV